MEGTIRVIILGGIVSVLILSQEMPRKKPRKRPRWTQSKPFYSKWINGIAATSFGIYLIHENPFVRPLLWGKWFDSSAYVNTPLYFVHLLASVIIVFVCCAVIDTLFWKLTVGKLFCLLRDKYLDKVIAFFKSLYHAIEKVFVKLI